MLTADHQITNGKGFCIMNNKGLIKEIFVMTLADAITAIAVFFFLVPSHTSISSISGLGIILTHFIPLPLSVITMALNILLLIIGFILCGKEFGAKTVYTSVMLPVFLGIFEKIFPDFTSLTGSQELDAVCYVLVVSIGLAMLFNMNASSGGLDIVAKIMNKYLHVDLGKAMSLSGMCVALSSAFVYDKKTVVLSVLGTYVNGIVLVTLFCPRCQETCLHYHRRKRKNSASSLLTICTAAQRSMKRSVRIILRNTMRSLRSWTSVSIRHS